MTPGAAIQAGLLGWRHRRGLRRGVALLAATGIAIIGLPVLVLAMLASLAGQGQAMTRVEGTRGLPAAARPWVPLVNLAGQAFSVNPYLLLGVLQEETAFGTHPDTYGANFAGCCHGPFQINVTDGPPSTWDTVKNAHKSAPRPASYIHPAEPHPSVYDSFDSAMAAAAVLRSKAGGRRLLSLDAVAWQAARGYNGAGPVAEAYADRVLAAARGWEAQQPDASSSPVSDGRLGWPVRGPVVSGFGMRWGRLHAGVDIAVPAGTPILAAAAGRVLQSGWVGGYGNFTCLGHRPALATCYAHQSRFAPGMVAGRWFARGQTIGYVGCTGRCFGDHLHFEVHTSSSIHPGTAVDPMPYLPPPG